MAKHALITNEHQALDSFLVRDYIDLCSDFELGVVLRHVIREVGNRDLHVDIAMPRAADAAKGLRHLVPLMAAELAKVGVQ